MMDTSAATGFCGEHFYGEGVADFLTGEMEWRLLADSRIWFDRCEFCSILYYCWASKAVVLTIRTGSRMILAGEHDLL